MANGIQYDCNLCIHMNVCPAYEVTQAKCDDYIPQGNVIPVVRCKDCKHGEVDDPDFPDQHYCHAGCGWNDKDFFCAYGERKSGTQPQREDV